MESVIAALTLALAGLSSACLLLMVVAVVRLAVADGAHEPLASLRGARRALERVTALRVPSRRPVATV